MPVYDGEVWHSVSRRWDSASRAEKIRYEAANYAVDVPAKGQTTRSVQCPVCGEVFNVVLRSGRRNGLVNGFVLAVLIVIFAGIGWLLLKADIIESLYWIPRMLIFGIAPLFAGGLIYIVVFGVRPTADLPPNEYPVSRGGKHEFILKTKATPVKFWGTIGVVEVVGLMVGYWLI